ncbi:hypothetical protein C656_00595 [Enterococcus hirae 57-03-H11]|uniref:hypothetical protein n=1 Tax=Enterococcus hirae TaxID=1354 RepID=UPI000B539BD6|nr:hypothetical protein [Enterococcus hirae]OWW69275.1 hypothetical protein C656_00595 [Enterococcus hirae 57-03-H11]EMF0181983.1 hypothetical protein [Enterococcus hirae]EMF0196667.1 hypothetical protein [Enterococcus hirae]EMF0463480.1 hypothetical protein [Enterococcus hirae]MCL4589267.1 hypothetical protein [Enterococcus hirae]
MYKNWKKYTKNHPYASIIIVALVASLIGISIEYLLNRDFLRSGFGVTLILIIGQIVVVKKNKK